MLGNFTVKRRKIGREICIELKFDWVETKCGVRQIMQSSNQAIFCNTSNGGCYNPSLDFPNRTPYEIDFGINK